MYPSQFKILHKKIHPPEADALANVYGRASGNVLQYTDELEAIWSELDGSWEGQQRDRFVDTFKNIRPQARLFALGTLEGYEKLFRTILVEVEEQVPIDPRIP